MTGTVLRSLPTLISDAELLGRFVASRDESVFAELVRRHGPVVYRVCRRIVGANAADDAFQATFLVLATSGEKVRKAASVGSWLIGVAGRVARQMRRRELRHEVLVNRQCEPPGERVDANDLASVLDEELTRLPSALRGPVVACLIQHRTHKQAAVELGESERTLRRRLNEAKRLLRMRLERRGVVPAVAAALVCGVGAVPAQVPANLSERAVVLVFDFLAGGVAVASAPAMIAKGVNMTAMTRTVKAVLVLAAVGLTAVGIGLAGNPPKAETIPRVDRREPNSRPFKPAPDGWTTTVDPAKSETKNFVVTAVDPLVVRVVATEAEHQRKAVAEKWLGKELPAWDRPCQIHVMTDATNGHSTLSFNSAANPPKLKSAEMTLAGSLESVLRVQLPHEVMHTVLASHFGKPLPRWADEGIALTAESYAEQATHDAKCREVLNAGRGIPLDRLLKMKEYPQDVVVLYAQGHSLVRFLLSRKPQRGEPETDRAALVARDRKARVTLLAFIADGQRENTTDGWNATAKTHYAFANVDAMQEAWIDWLKTPESSMADGLAPKKPKPTGERKDDDSLIPPTKLDK